MLGTSTTEIQVRAPEARYSYYRRCQVFRRNGEQCKAPAEKGATICHAHATQQAMAFRRDLERRIVLAEAVAQMRRRGKLECEIADLWTDFNGIQVTLAVVSRALIAGRIDCKTAGRLLVHLQTMSKLLWMVHRKGRKENQGLPQTCADERRLKAKTSPLINTDNTDLNEDRKLIVVEETPLHAIHDEKSRVAVDGKIREFPEESRSMQHGTWEEARAA
jgi:hypothetical protein